MKNKVRYFVISDIHLGHRLNPTKNILEGLKFLLDLDKPNIFSLDIIFIAGDLFDSALWFSNEDVTRSLLFVRELMQWCETFKVKLRILEGTPSHDRKQSRNLIPISQTFKNLDFKYVETMCIEFFKDLGLTCLYVPDEFGGSAKEAQKLIEKELNLNNLTAVDIAIMHGMFKYQVPEITNDRFKHEEQFFLKIVRFFINIGHIHVFSTFERIIAQGSTDRLCHNEEKPKGGCMMTIDRLKENYFQFKENKLATVFKTIVIKSKDLEKNLAEIKNKVKLLPAFSHVRIKTFKGNPLLNAIDVLSKEYPFLFFTKLDFESEVTINNAFTKRNFLNFDYVPFQLNKDNLVGLLMKEVVTKHPLNGNQLSTIEAKLKDLLK